MSAVGARAFPERPLRETLAPCACGAADVDWLAAAPLFLLTISALPETERQGPTDQRSSAPSRGGALPLEPKWLRNPRQAGSKLHVAESCAQAGP